METKFGIENPTMDPFKNGQPRNLDTAVEAFPRVETRNGSKRNQIMATVAGNHDQDQITNYEHTTMG
jgi:hypothetical protein